MAGGAGFIDYSRQQRPDGQQVGQALMQQRQAQAPPMAPMGDHDADDAMGRMAPPDGDADDRGTPGGERVLVTGADGAPYDPEVEHSPASTRTALNDAVRHAMQGRSRAQSPQIANTRNKDQLRALGVPETEITVGSMTGLYKV